MYLIFFLPPKKAEAAEAAVVDRLKVPSDLGEMKLIQRI